MPRQARLRLLESYAWSSYPGYVEEAQKLEFVCYELLKDYGRTMAEARRQYRAYTAACVLEDDGPILEAMAASRYAIGSSRFIEATEQRLAGRRSGRLQDRDVALPRTTLAIERIDEVVAEHYGLPVETLPALRLQRLHHLALPLHQGFLVLRDRQGEVQSLQPGVFHPLCRGNREPTDKAGRNEGGGLPCSRGK